MSYSLIRPLLFALPPEAAHAVTLATLDLLHRVRLDRLASPPRVEAPVRAMGLSFPNAIGMAAGLDKNADHVRALSGLGFGFLELGTVTPAPQPGNPKPRLFRLRGRRALINRMGFNSKGLGHLCARLEAIRPDCPVGVNIGRNKDTPDERAVDDYLEGLRAVHALADYVTVNVSSPNTAGLRGMQEADVLNPLLEALAAERDSLATHGSGVPLVLKVAPDLEDAQIQAIARAVSVHGIDGLIATNTTVSRDGVEGERHAGESGGLSGAPLSARALAVLGAFREALPESVTLIASGGVMSVEDALARRRAGADLVQLYTGLIYGGPSLVSACAEALGHD